MSNPIAFQAKDFKAFYNDASFWTEGAYHDDFAWHTTKLSMAECEGLEVTSLDDNDLVFIDSGYIISEDGFPAGHIFEKKSDVDFEQALSAWMALKGTPVSAQKVVHVRFDTEKIPMQELMAFVRGKDPSAAFVDGLTLRVIP